MGCGAGLQCLLLAKDVGDSGHVTGLDISPEFLEYGRTLAKDSGLQNRISFREGRAEAIPLADNSVDWAWSADCVGYGPWEPEPMLLEMARVTKPGGTVAILAWSSEMLLPGYPQLEAKLRATTAGLAPFAKEMKPSRHFARGLGMLRSTGIDAPKATAFSGSVHAPLSDTLYGAMEDLFEMRWPGVTDELTDCDRAEYLRLCEKSSPDYVLNHPDYFAFFTYAMFHGTIG